MATSPKTSEPLEILAFASNLPPEVESPEWIDGSLNWTLFVNDELRRAWGSLEPLVKAAVFATAREAAQYIQDTASK